MFQTTIQWKCCNITIVGWINHISACWNCWRAHDSAPFATAVRAHPLWTPSDWKQNICWASGTPEFALPVLLLKDDEASDVHWFSRKGIWDEHLFCKTNCFDVEEIAGFQGLDQSFNSSAGRKGRFLHRDRSCNADGTKDLRQRKQDCSSSSC